jgi:hypothetical protein
MIKNMTERIDRMRSAYEIRAAFEDVEYGVRAAGNARHLLGLPGLKDLCKKARAGAQTLRYARRHRTI